MQGNAGGGGDVETVEIRTLADPGCLDRTQNRLRQAFAFGSGNQGGAVGGGQGSNVGFTLRRKPPKVEACCLQAGQHSAGRSMACIGNGQHAAD